MSVESILPYLSQFDPPQQSEGSLDPLGLYSIADALGVRLAPGIRERQTTPRFLTLALVGMVACGESYAADSKGIPPWLVYEWLIVESLVRQLRGTPELQGVPGPVSQNSCRISKPRMIRDKATHNETTKLLN